MSTVRRKSSSVSRQQAHRGNNGGEHESLLSKVVSAAGCCGHVASAASCVPPLLILSFNSLPLSSFSPPPPPRPLAAFVELNDLKSQTQQASAHSTPHLHSGRLLCPMHNLYFFQTLTDNTTGENHQRWRYLLGNFQSCFAII